MSRVVVNDDGLLLSEAETFSSKVRAVLLEDDKMLMAYYGGVYLFPGGTIEKEEDPDLAIIRELKEETGIDYDINKLKKLYTLKYYQKNYPVHRDLLRNRLLLTEFYLVDYQGVDLSKIDRTEKEKRDGFHLQLVKFSEINDILNEKTDNPRKKYFDREIDETVKVLKLKR